MSHGTPAAEFDITPDLVRRLLARQHADLADEPLTPFLSGWDNVMFRLGAGLCVRLPRREMAAPLVRNELRWLPELAPRLPIPIPAPVRAGAPDLGYPWAWSVVPFLPGEAADQCPPGSHEADRLARFLRALHARAPDNAPVNPYRGVPLMHRADVLRERIERVREQTGLITPAIDSAWQSALAASPSDQQAWLHGDLHAQNVLVADGCISAVVDWGDLTRGDPATDLAAVWSLFDRAEDRQRALTVYDPDPATARRARGWAVMFGTVLVDSGLVNSPRHARQGEAMLRRVHADTMASISLDEFKC